MCIMSLCPKPNHLLLFTGRKEMTGSSLYFLFFSFSQNKPFLKEYYFCFLLTQPSIDYSSASMKRKVSDDSFFQGAVAFPPKDVFSKTIHKWFLFKGKYPSDTFFSFHFLRQSIANAFNGERVYSNGLPTR